MLHKLEIKAVGFESVGFKKKTAKKDGPALVEFSIRGMAKFMPNKGVLGEDGLELDRVDLDITAIKQIEIMVDKDAQFVLELQLDHDETK